MVNMVHHSRSARIGQSILIGNLLAYLIHVALGVDKKVRRVVVLEEYLTHRLSMNHRNAGLVGLGNGLGVSNRLELPLP